MEHAKNTSNTANTGHSKILTGDKTSLRNREKGPENDVMIDLVLISVFLTFSNDIHQ